MTDEEEQINGQKKMMIIIIIMLMNCEFFVVTMIVQIFNGILMHRKNEMVGGSNGISLTFFNAFELVSYTNCRLCPAEGVVLFLLLFFWNI